MTKPADDRPEEDITHLLLSWSHGDRQAHDQLWACVEDVLRRMASGLLRRERPDHTLETGSLVNEAYLRLVDQSQVSWRDRAHFFGLAASIMRRILVDYARRHESEKRGGGVDKVSLADLDGDVAVAVQPDLLDLDNALALLAERDPEMGRLVELRYFGGLTKNETAAVMGISGATVVRRWRMARAWLHGYLVERKAHDP